MVPGHRILRGKVPLSDHQKIAYKDLLKNAFKDPWWRQYVMLVEREIDSLVIALVLGGVEKSEEDKIRGKLQTFAWILSQDDFAAELNDPKYRESDMKISNNRKEQVLFDDEEA